MTFDIGASQMGEGGGQKAQICALSFMQRERHETLTLKGLKPGLLHKNNLYIQKQGNLTTLNTS